jgi:hypothetical protein
VALGHLDLVADLQVPDERQCVVGAELDAACRVGVEGPSWNAMPPSAKDTEAPAGGATGPCVHGVSTTPPDRRAGRSACGAGRPFTA